MRNTITLAAQQTPPERWRGALSAATHSAAAALAHAPENAAYGLMAMAPLGAFFGPQAMMLALLGAVIANALASSIGGGWLVSGPRASLALLTAGLVAALLPHIGLQGEAAVWPILQLLAVGLVGAGLLQMGFGLLKLGTIVKYTPHPVRVGLTSGVGLLLVLTALPMMLGYGFGASLMSRVGPPLGGATLVGLVALGTAWGAQRLRAPVPPVLLGLAAGGLVQALLEQAGTGLRLGALIGAPTLGDSWIAHAGQAGGLGIWSRPTIALVASYALTVAALCSLDTLLAVSVVDGRQRTVRDANRELTAQGIANVAVALAGGPATSPSIPRSLALVLPCPGRRHIVLAYTAALGLLLLVAPQVLGHLPASAVGGVLLLQGAQMVAPSLWRTPAGLWADRRNAGGSGQQRLLLANWAVATGVAGNAIVLGLGPAVFIGALFAVLLFVRANMRDVVGRAWTGATRRSLKSRPQAVAETLRAAGHRITLLELEGSLFFGTADAVRVRLQGLDCGVETLILDLHQVNEIDVTAARILMEIAEDFACAGRALVLAEWAPGDPRRLAVEAAATPQQLQLLQFEPDTDRALERAEERLLARLKVEGDTGPALDLARTMLGRGLDAGELALLAAQTTLVRFEAGTVLFRLGDAGDALFVSLEGDIGLRIPGSTRRLISFAPGVTIGEMAVLVHGHRSAEAYAETDVVALRLSVEAFDQLLLEQPKLAAKMLKSMTLHLADRLRIVTGDLAHWVSRAAAGRPNAPVGAEQVTRNDDDSEA